MHMRGVRNCAACVCVWSSCYSLRNGSFVSLNDTITHAWLWLASTVANVLVTSWEINKVSFAECCVETAAERGLCFILARWFWSWDRLDRFELRTTSYLLARSFSKANMMSCFSVFLTVQCSYSFILSHKINTTFLWLSAVMNHDS